MVLFVNGKIIGSLECILVEAVIDRKRFMSRNNITRIEFINIAYTVWL